MIKKRVYFLNELFLKMTEAAKVNSCCPEASLLVQTLVFSSGYDDIWPVEGAIISVFRRFGAQEQKEHSDIKSQEYDQN